MLLIGHYEALDVGRFEFVRGYLREEGVLGHENHLGNYCKLDARHLKGG